MSVFSKKYNSDYIIMWLYLEWLYRELTVWEKLGDLFLELNDMSSDRSALSGNVNILERPIDRGPKGYYSGVQYC